MKLPDLSAVFHSTSQDLQQRLAASVNQFSEENPPEEDLLRGLRHSLRTIEHGAEMIGYHAIQDIARLIANVFQYYIDHRISSDDLFFDDCRFAVSMLGNGLAAPLKCGEAHVQACRSLLASYAPDNSATSQPRLSLPLQPTVAHHQLAAEQGEQLYRLTVLHAEGTAQADIITALADLGDVRLITRDPDQDHLDLLAWQAVIQTDYTEHQLADHLHISIELVDPVVPMVQEHTTDLAELVHILVDHGKTMALDSHHPVSWKVLVDEELELPMPVLVACYNGIIHFLRHIIYEGFDEPHVRRQLKESSYSHYHIDRSAKADQTIEIGLHDDGHGRAIKPIEAGEQATSHERHLYAQHTIQEYGGTLICHSTPDHGSEIILSFPCCSQLDALINSE